MCVQGHLEKKWQMSFKLINARVDIVLPHYYRLSRHVSISKKWLISQSKWFGFIISSMCGIAFSVFSPLCDSNEDESRYWGKSFHFNQGESIKADESILSFTPGFQRRNHSFVFTGFIKSVNRSAHNCTVYVKAGSGYVLWKDHDFWSYIVMNSVYDMD